VLMPQTYQFPREQVKKWAPTHDPARVRALDFPGIPARIKGFEPLATPSEVKCRHSKKRRASSVYADGQDLRERFVP